MLKSADTRVYHGRIVKAIIEEARRLMVENDG